MLYDPRLRNLVFFALPYLLFYMRASSFGDNYNCTLNILTKKIRRNKKSAYDHNGVSDP